MIRCLAIDDEPLALRQLVTYISKVPFLTLAAQCQSAIEARAFLQNDTVDAIFCDINMPDLDGMHFVKSLVAPPLIVFTTAYADYAVEGFRVNAVDYLLKPFGMQDFLRAANRLRERWKSKEEETQEDPPPFPSLVGRGVDTFEGSNPSHSLMHPTPLPTREGQGGGSSPSGVESPGGGSSSSGLGSSPTLFLKSDSRIVKVSVPDIRYVESMSEYLKVWLDSQPKPIITLLSMKKMQDFLPAYFMRIHRSFIINTTKIQEVTKNRVILGTDACLPIGDLYKDDFMEFVNKQTLSK